MPGTLVTRAEREDRPPIIYNKNIPQHLHPGAAMRALFPRRYWISLLVIVPPTTQHQILPGLSPHLSSRALTPEAGLTGAREPQTAGSLSRLAQSRSQLPAHPGHKVLLRAACCVWGHLCPGCPGRLRFSTEFYLKCPDGDPRASLTSRPGKGPEGQSHFWLQGRLLAECSSVRWPGCPRRHHGHLVSCPDRHGRADVSH